MSTKNLNPPFYNKTLEDFFDFKCDNQSKAVFLQNWIIDNYPDLKCEIMYSVPMFKILKKNICYFQYIIIDNQLELQICFGKGNQIEDRYNLFKKGPKVYKAIIISSIEDEFLNKLKSYINQSIEIWN